MITLISFRSLYSQILEYMGGGDLLNLLIERDVFDEDFTRFYVAEVRLIPSAFFALEADSLSC